ncbi:unnamed protein product, partial [marine sediment metagenome]
MLGIFNVLPFLQGWMYKRHRASRTNVRRGAVPIEVVRKNETGLVYNMIAVSDDCYGTLQLEVQGADLEFKTESLYAQMFRSLGMVSQDPSGWTSLYRRNNPNSTRGSFVGLTTGGFQGSAFPYQPSIVLKLYLPSESTQKVASIMGIADVIAITNREKFIRSLRRLLEAKADLWVDPALLDLSADFEKFKK